MSDGGWRPSAYRPGRISPYSMGRTRPANAERLLGLVGIHRAKGGGEIERSRELAERVAGDGEVPPPHPGAALGEPFGHIEKDALGGARGVVAKLRVAKLGLLHEHGELAAATVDVELLEGEWIQGCLLSPLARRLRSPKAQHP